MKDPDWDPVPLIAGSGGVLTEELRTSHAGRRALMLTRDENPTEFLALAELLSGITLLLEPLVVQPVFAAHILIVISTRKRVLL